MGGGVTVNAMDGRELRAFRDRLGLSQSGLAVKLGIAANTVARWERGEREIPPFLRLALERLESLT